MEELPVIRPEPSASICGIAVRANVPARVLAAESVHSGRLEIQRIDFLHPSVTHKQRRTIGRKPHPRRPGLHNAAKALQTSDALGLAAGQAHAVYGGVGARAGIEVDVLAVDGPLRPANVGVNQIRPLLCSEVEELQLLSIRGGRY